MFGICGWCFLSYSPIYSLVRLGSVVFSSGKSEPLATPEQRITRLLVANRRVVFSVLFAYLPQLRQICIDWDTRGSKDESQVWSSLKSSADLRPKHSGQKEAEGNRHPNHLLAQMDLLWRFAAGVYRVGLDRAREASGEAHQFGGTHKGLLDVWGVCRGASCFVFLSFSSSSCAFILFSSCFPVILMRPLAQVTNHLVCSTYRTPYWRYMKSIVKALCHRKAIASSSDFREALQSSDPCSSESSAEMGEVKNLFKENVFLLVFRF